MEPNDDELEIKRPFINTFNDTKSNINAEQNDTNNVEDDEDHDEDLEKKEKKTQIIDNHHYSFLRDEEKTKIFKVVCNHLSVGQFELARATFLSLIGDSSSNESFDNFCSSLFTNGIPKQWFEVSFYFLLFLFCIVLSLGYIQSLYQLHFIWVIWFIWNY
jgi:hypothetical protein